MTDQRPLQRGLPDPISPPSNDNTDSWSNPDAIAPWYKSTKVKVAGVGILFVCLVGVSMHVLSPAQGANEQHPFEGSMEPLVSERALSRLNMDRMESALQCEDAFIGGQRMGSEGEGQLVEIRNQHAFPILLSFFDYATKEKVAVVGIESRTSQEVFLPINTYTIEAITGTDWCSNEVGFRQGSKVNMRESFKIDDETRVRLEFVTDGPRPRDFQPRLFESPVAKRAMASNSRTRDDAHISSDGSKAGKQTGRQQGRGSEEASAHFAEERQIEPYQVVGEGSLVLRQVFGNNYFVTGTVNNFPVVFTVDPGAPSVVLPQHIAARAGIRSCVQRQITTSAGSVRGCAARIDDIRFGELRVRNTEALILPTPTGDAVIGMNVLSRFKVVQANSTLSINTQRLATVQ